jgi:hypothetical protein
MARPSGGGRLADLLRAAGEELDAWAQEATGGRAAPDEAIVSEATVSKMAHKYRVADKYREVLLAARSAGVSPQTAAMADAVAIYSLRISDDLRAVADEAPPSRPSGRSLLGR